MFKPGSIRKIQVQNFVTYSYVEMVPGPNLNMIIGPNGTGKSTIVAAIILGLGGNPKVVGRGTKISEYVKHECESATINIHLQDEDENKFIKITRQFDTSDKTHWRINNVRASEADVMKCIKKFNIQVNNLCQFLPQDRVQDFAKLNKQNLLKETQSALCRNDLIEKQNALIDARETQKDLLLQTDKHIKKLQEAKDENARLEGRVENFKKKMKYKEKIADIDRKIAWTTYEELRAKLSELKKDKLKACEIVEKHTNELKPMEKEIKINKQKVTEMQQRSSKTTQNIRSAEANMNATNEKIETLGNKVREIEDDMNNKLAEIEQWDNQIEQSVKKLEEMKTLHGTMQAKIDQGDQDRNQLPNEISKCTHVIRSLQDRKDQYEETRRGHLVEIRALENEQSRLENVKQTRLDHLHKINSDAYQAVLWLRNNRHLFKGEIFEPIMLELNVLDNSKAKYVEACIPMNDRLAFTCVEKEDMNLLIRSLRGQKNLSVNVLHSGPARERYNQPKMPIEHLRKYGFYTYVNSLFTAPEPIMRYLCKTYNLHNIPIGDNRTNACFESIPKAVNVFFSDSYRFSINFSKYSGEKISRQVQINGDGGLSLSLDVVRLENIKGRSNELQRNIQNLDQQIQNYQGQVEKVQEKIQLYRDKLNEIQKYRQQAQVVRSKIHAAERNLNEMRLNKKSPEAIRNEANQKINKFSNSMALLQETLKEELKKLASYVIESGLISSKIDLIRNNIDRLENEIKDSKRKLQEYEDMYNAIIDKYNSVMAEAKAQLTKAKEQSNGFTPVDEGFEEFRQTYETLSNNIEELNAEKENINSRIACLNTADDGEMREYEERISLIEDLERAIERANLNVNKVNSKLDRMQEEWLVPLRELVAGINLRFARAFERMGCAGEVTICTGDNELNFSNYGLSIKVTYRDGEPLQELNSTVQSGGERAVATAAFMLSLQELTPVPFRCVDEINQGMDANNERRIFELIVETTCQENTSQYFLITPKLVPHLRYSKQLMVHFVHNGPFINPDRKWSTSKLCNPYGIEVQG